MSSSDSAAQHIAIVGLAGRFPGARDVAEFWENLIAGRSGITQLSDEQLAAAGYDPAAVRALPGYVAARGLLDRPEWFDRAFFGIAPKEAEAMDPQYRVFFETAWAALEDAGCDPASFPGLIGVFAGMSNNTYYPHFVRQRRDLIEAVGAAGAVIGNEKDFLATRLAHKLNLRGPALTIQTACSTSLVAVCVACQNLLEHQCDVALAGGVSITFPHQRGYFSEEGGMTSTDGVCSPFDVRANGTVFGNGAGVVVLKRLADALADGDQVYAVIRGQAVNNDGAKKVSYAAPSVDGHIEVIALAQAVAGVTADTISYVEAHGTATPLGDPIEIAGLTQVFRESTDAKQTCPVGSVKGNIGHLDAASGVASLIKAALAMRHATLPPSLNCHNANPALHLDDSPFFINTELRRWPAGATPRRAGVSSFGVGGTNAHVILEEAPAVPAPVASDAPQLLVLSAKTPAALEQRARDLAAHLEKTPALPLADVAFTLQTGRQTFAHRRAVVARTAEEAVAALRGPAKLHRVEDRHDTPVAFLFPGQGSQYPGMGAQLHADEPVFREALAECARVLRPELSLDLCELLFSRDAEAEARLRETRFTQPAIFAVSYALARTWLARGFQPVALLGHSVGEFVAAAIAGVFSWEDAARLVALRARLTQELPRGAMLAARLGEDEAREFLSDPRLAIAAVNSPKLCVISGPFEAIEALETTLAARSITARRLATSHAFHSPMVDPVVEPLAAALREITLRAPQIPIVSSATGEWLSDAEATDPAYWAAHLRATVRFSAAATRLLAGNDCALLECGPGQTLSQLVRQNPARTPRHEVAHSIAEATDENESLAAAVGRLWLAGVPIDWSAARAGAPRRRVSLPTYPFERQRYFADLPTGVPTPITTAATDGDAPPEADALRGVTRVAAIAAIATDAETPASDAPAVTAGSSLSQLKQILADLSGLDLAETPGSTSLLDLGFDSLFLSQVAITITRRFGAKITLRQLLGDLGTLDALATALPTAGSAPARTATATVELPASPASTGAHGPFKPLQRDAGATLTAAQQRWLDDFIARYVARTSASKKHTQENRAHFADPRAIAGFKQLWKEIVYPIVADRSAGSRLWDIDGNEWLDVTLSYGAAMLGHQPPFVVEALRAQLDRGFEIGPTSPLAGEVAALLCEMTGMERATFCNTGSEAVTGALRAARTVTGRTKVVYFRDSYHGIDNEVLGRRAGQAVLPIAPGIPNSAVGDTIILDYDDPRSLEIIAAQAGDIAAVLVEPVQSRHPALQPREFLHALRALTERHGIALIFDEIIAGFRCHPGGAQAFFGVRADLSTYGKVLGGGLPIGALAGRAEYMDAFDGGAWSYGDESFPGAAVTFFAGTFVRHPLALAAARAVLKHLKENGPALQETLAQRASGMIERIAASFAGSPFTAQRFASSWLVQGAPEFKYSGLLFAALRQRGIHIWENRPCFVSTAHTDADLDRVATAFAESVAELESAGFFSRSAVAPVVEDAPTGVTEAQQELWLVCQQGAIANSACNETWTLALDGELDLAALRQAAQTIVDRHESFRSTFAKSGESIVVAPALKIEIPLHDFSGDPAAESRFDALRAAESARVFDLERGPLLVLQLVRFASERHALIFNAHHLICDGWSCDVFLNELSTLYSAAREGRPAELSQPMTMRDYARFTAALHGTPEFAADAEFWREAYRTVPPALTLPGDRPYPKQRTFRGASEIVILPAAFAQSVSRFGAQNGATFFSVLLAGFKALLFRLSGQGDFAVGVPSAGQNLVEGGPLIGHCVNMLPLRSQLRAEQSFAELVKGVQSTVLDAFEHQRVTFGWLLRQLSFSREPGRIPLIPVTFNVDPPLSHIRFAGLRHRLVASPRSAFQFDLGINCDNTPDGLRVLCNYNADVFDPATIRHWVGQFRQIMETVIADPAQTLGALPVAPRAAAAEPIQFWPSSPTAGDGVAFDDVLYNAMTLDRSRHDCYRRAIELSVKGRVVADLGTGRDALLARMCIEAGAAKVYAVELLERPAQQARELVERLGLADKITVLQGNSRDVQLPERVDVCISENVGHIGAVEGNDLMLDDARTRMLKPGGIVIPGHCDTRVAAVSLPAAALEKPVFETLGAHYADQLCRRAGYKHDFRLCVMGASRALLRSTHDIFESIDFTQPAQPRYERKIQLTITEDSSIDGLLLWLFLEPIPGVSIESIDHQDAWLPVYLPVFYPPIGVAKGDRIEATVRGDLAENNVNRDYHVAGEVIGVDGTRRAFSFDSWHYRNVFRGSPFYDHLFAGDAIRVAEALPAPVAPAPAGEALRNVIDLFETQAARTPDNVAVATGAERISYRVLNERANQLARHLQRAGVSGGDCVGIALPRSIDFIVGALAILKAGGAYVPLDPGFPEERIAGILRDTRAALVLTAGGVLRPLSSSPAKLIEVDRLDLSGEDTANSVLPRSADDLAYVMFTSGSTGRPKGAEILHRGISRLVVKTDYAQLRADDVVAHISSVAFDAATFEIWGALLNGGRLEIIAKDELLDPRQFAATFAHREITAAFVTTPWFHQIAAEVPEAFGTLRYLLVGGDVLDPATARAVLESARPPLAMIHVYGPTETTTFATAHRIAAVPRDATRIPIGRAIANTTVHLLDAQGQSVRPGEQGEIHIGGPGVARGYVARPDLTAASFVRDSFSADGNARLYKTGDLARALPDGSLDFLGRIDDQVKVRGFRVEPGEVEAALRQHPRVRECKVVARQSGAGGHALAGYVSPRAGAALTVEDLRDFLGRRLPEFMVPASFSVLESLPLNANGKLDLPALAESEPAPIAPQPQVAPASPIEQGITELWQEVLGRNHLSRDDDFFLVGGHSLLAIRLIARLRERFSVDVPVQRLFETPTIAGLGDFIAEHLPTMTPGSAESLVMIQKGDAQRRPLYLVPGGWGGEIEFLVYAELVRNMDRTLPLYGLRARASNTDPLPDKTVEEFAAAFIDDITRFQPEGPYMLGGECVGGVVAYEMARQLEAAGRKVSLVLLLDTEWPSEAGLRLFDEWDVKRRAEEAARHRRTLGQHWAEARKCGPLGMLRYAWRHFRPGALERQISGFIAERARFTAWPRRLMNFPLQPHNGRITLLQDEATSRTGDLAVWRQHHSGELDVHIVTGDHASYIREHAPEAAAKIREIIDLANQPAHAHRD
jgi:amino acid adenylation domain-containing protein